MPAKPRKIVAAQGVAIVNHYAAVSLLRIVNLLRRSNFSTAGSFGKFNERWDHVRFAWHGNGQKPEMEKKWKTK